MDKIYDEMKQMGETVTQAKMNYFHRQMRHNKVIMKIIIDVQLKFLSIKTSSLK